MSILREKTHTHPLLKGHNTLAIFHGILQMKALKKGKHSHRVISYLYISIYTWETSCFGGLRDIEWTYRSTFLKVVRKLTIAIGKGIP